MKRRIRRIRRALKRAGLYNVFHITLIAVLLTGFCVILFNVKEPEQQEKEPEEIQAEVMQNPETMTQTAENIEDKYKVFDTIENEPTADVYKRYQVFCADNAMQPMSNIVFSKQINKRLGFRVIQKKVNNKNCKIFVS